MVYFYGFYAAHEDWKKPRLVFHIDQSRKCILKCTNYTRNCPLLGNVLVTQGYSTWKTSPTFYGDFFNKHVMCLNT